MTKELNREIMKRSRRNNILRTKSHKNSPKYNKQRRKKLLRTTKKIL